MISSTVRQPNPATMKPAAATAWHCLTQRERDVLQAFFHLADDVRVARSLGLARQTVTNHMNHIQRKLSVVSRAGLMKFIYEHRVNDSFG